MLFTEVLARTTRALGGQGITWLFVLLAAVLAALPQLRRLWERPAVRWSALGLVLVLGTLWAWSLVWASDDAYISFRYARHLARGNGLVFNVGERVEGYTDFLWAVIVAVLIWLGAPAGESAILVSLAAFLGLLVTVWRLADRLSPARSRTLPVAAALTAASYTMASFATSGLETVLAALFVVAALSAAESRRPATAGTLAVLAILCHPDHLLFYVGLGAAWALTLRSWRDLLRIGLRYAAPFVLIFLPYFAWRWHYYGDLFPNTYYAKSGSLTYFSQGGIYLLVTFVTGGLWAAVPLAARGAWHLRRSITGWFAVVALPLYLVYVAKIGGDFMLGRLYVPVLPVVFVLVEVGLRSLLARTTALPSGRARVLNQVGTAALALLTAVSALPVRAVNPGEIFYGIADERTFTVLGTFSPLSTGAAGYHVGKGLHEAFKARGMEPKVAIFSIGMAGYYSDLPLYDLRGLTSRNVAHLPITTRGRPGHEKLASPGMVLESGAALSELDVYPSPYHELGQAMVNGFHFTVVRFDASLATALVERHGVLDFRAHLDRKLPTFGAIMAQDPARAACDLWHMRSYYFAGNDDPSRRRAVGSALAPGDEAGIALWDGWLAGARKTEIAPPGWQRLQGPDHRFETWSASGDAATWLVRETPPNQMPPSTALHRMPFVDTFTAAGADGSTGTLVSPPFVLEGDAITLEVAGGLVPHEAHVDLLIDGQPVATATACGAEVWGARLWDVRRFRGRTASVAIVDSSGGPWAHLEVQSIDQWKLPAP